MNIVTIMNYDKNKKEYHKMCKIFMDLVIQNGGDNIKVLYLNNKPDYINDFKNRINLTIEKGFKDHRIGRDHFNAYFKLPNLCNINTEFIFLDCDMYVLTNLNYIWNLRKDKPWIGVNHQWIPKHPDTHRKPFLNSGLQIVSDPNFYNYDKILKSHIDNHKNYSVPGVDQSILNTYFKSIKYDYVHNKVGFGWNSCAAVGYIYRDREKWKGITKGLNENNKIHINHYWCDYKPWKIKCPIHMSYK